MSSSAAPADDGILGSEEKWLALLLSSSVERKGIEKGPLKLILFPGLLMPLHGD